MRLGWSDPGCDMGEAPSLDERATNVAIRKCLRSDVRSFFEEWNTRMVINPLEMIKSWHIKKIIKWPGNLTKTALKAAYITKSEVTTSRHLFFLHINPWVRNSYRHRGAAANGQPPLTLPRWGGPEEESTAQGFSRELPGLEHPGTTGIGQIAKELLHAKDVEKNYVNFIPGSHVWNSWG